MTRFSPLALFFAFVLLEPGLAVADQCKDATPEAKPVATVTIDPSTPWQPRGGELRFIVTSADAATATLLKDAKAVACFRWTGPDPQPNPNEFIGPIGVTSLSYSSTSTSSKAVFGVTVPETLPEVSSNLWQRFWDPKDGPFQFILLRTIPKAVLRVVLLDANGKSIVVADQTFGVTSLLAACFLTILAVIVAALLLDLWARARHVPGGNPVVRLISTRDGYVSLSQFQIMLWSFLFGAGAVYVMGLSGSLIDIPSGALVLLGIAGASTVAAKIKTANAGTTDSATPPAQPRPASLPSGPVSGLMASAQSAHGVGLEWTAPATVPNAPVDRYRVEYSVAGLKAWQSAGPPVIGTSMRVEHLIRGTQYDFQVFAENSAGASAATSVASATLAQGAPAHVPSWSDLVTTPTHPSEIDVTRVQMLFFTLISAGFVAIKLFTSYTIPDIPQGFMLLMGISNGVYISAKFVRD